jgi:tetraacyldisaccharide 4'-kinase
MTTPAIDRLIEWPHGDTAARVIGASGQRHGPFATLALKALELPYRTGVRLRNSLYDFGLRRAYRAPIPVISIGNIVAGGAGKTPVTRWLVSELMARGRKVAVLHSGYGSDEPALHRLWHPDAIVIEEKDRIAGAKTAFDHGADVIVLDDAFQHRRLARDLDIVLLPVETPSSRLLPAGPLRESEDGLRRADFLLITRKTATAEQAQALATRVQEKVGTTAGVAAILPDTQIAATGPVVVVAAIARPDLLIEQLQAQGVEVAKAIAYPDHHTYTMRDAEHIWRAAGTMPIVTTEKDAIKLTSVIDPDRLQVVRQKLVFESGRAALLHAIEQVL